MIRFFSFGVVEFFVTSQPEGQAVGALVSLYMRCGKKRFRVPAFSPEGSPFPIPFAKKKLRKMPFAFLSNHPFSKIAFGPYPLPAGKPHVLTIT